MSESFRFRARKKNARNFLLSKLLRAFVVAEAGFKSTIPASVTRWYSSAVFRHFRLFCTKNGAELAQEETSQIAVYEWLLLHNLTILRNLSTLFSTPPLKSLRRLWHYDTRFLLSNKSFAIVFCLSSHCLCIMFMNCPYERGIILHHDHYLTIIIQMSISLIWLWKLYLHVASLIFKMLHNFYRHWNM